MGVLTYPTALATVQDALLNTIGLALSTRRTAANLVGLAAITTRTGGGAAVRDKALAYVTSVATVFRYSLFSTATVDGINVILPGDAAGGPGRWIKLSSAIVDPTGTALSSVSSGYLKRVMLWIGSQSSKTWDERILGVRPAVVLQFLGETKEIHANQRGALTNKEYHFSLWGVSLNLRPDAEAEKGSPIATEAAADPGVARIMGDLEYLLDGLRGVDMGVDGLDYVKVGAQVPAVENYDGREFIWTVPLDVRVTIGKEDPPTRYGLTDLRLQASDVQRHGQAKTDPNNQVLSGLVVGTGAGFSRAPTDGSAVVGGVMVTVTGAPVHVYTPQVATWRDLNPDGTFTYVESFGDDYQPPVTTGALRVAVTLTDASGITEDRFIASTATDIGPNNQILP